MAYTQAANKATQRYQKKAYDIINIRVKKGQRDDYAAFAASQGESVVGMIRRLVEAEMARAGWTPPAKQDEEEEEP